MLSHRRRSLHRMFIHLAGGDLVQLWSSGLACQGILIPAAGVAYSQATGSIVGWGDRTGRTEGEYLLVFDSKCLIELDDVRSEANIGDLICK